MEIKYARREQIIFYKWIRLKIESIFIRSFTWIFQMFAAKDTRMFDDLQTVPYARYFRFSTFDNLMSIVR